MRALFITVNPPEARNGVVNETLNRRSVSLPPLRGKVARSAGGGVSLRLAQLRSDAVDARLGTGLVIAAGRAGDADAANRVLANLDRKSAADADDSRKRRALRCARILSDLLGELRRR